MVEIRNKLNPRAVGSTLFNDMYKYIFSETVNAVWNAKIKTKRLWN